MARAPPGARIGEGRDGYRRASDCGCDGCTLVSELYWPTIYFPPCLRHDFDCIRGDGGTAASRRFYRLQRAYGMTALRSGLRASAVTLAWYAVLQWRRKGRLRK